jgi:hypothetical protein
MARRLIWTETGKLYSRVNVTRGVRAEYAIDLDQRPIDRWVLHVDGVRKVENIYFLTSAKHFAAQYDVGGPEGMDFAEDNAKRAKRDGGRPRRTS